MDGIDGLWKDETGNCLMILKHEREYNMRLNNKITKMTHEVISGKYGGVILISVTPKRKTRLVVMDTEAGIQTIYVKQGGEWY